MDELVTLLAQFDVCDLAAGAGALQLLPANAPCLLRLEFLFGAVGHLRLVEQKPALPNREWEPLVNDSPLANPLLVTLEDPAEYPFTDAVTFAAGSFIVLPGLADEAVFIVRNLLHAFFCRETPTNGKLNCRRKAGRLGLAVLTLSNEIATRAGIDRGMKPGELSESCTVPEEGHFATLKSAVTFTEAELCAILGRMHLDIADLEPLVMAAGQGPRPSIEQPVGAAASRPILKIEQKIIVSPSSLLGALRHALINFAVESGELSDLALRYRAAVAIATIHALKRMGLRVQGLTAPDDRSRPFVEGAFSFDTDKILHLVLVCDPLTDYDAATQPGSWDSDELVPHIEAVCATAQKTFFRPGAVIRQVLHVVVFQGAGRATYFGFNGMPNPSTSRLLVLTAEELETISLLEGVHQLTLWQFAQAYNQAHETMRIFSFGTLSEFSLYRSHHSSYYVTDGPAPNELNVVPWYGLAERLEAQRRWDFHGVVSPDGSGVKVVALVNCDRAIPIYADYPPDRVRPAQLLEGLTVPIWVLASGDEATREPNRYLHFLFVDAITYWLWQCSPELGSLVDAFRGRVAALNIEVQLLPDLGWTNQEPTGDSTLTCTPVGSGVVRLTVGSQMAALLATPDNAAERSLLAEVFRGLRRLGEEMNVPFLAACDDAAIAALLDRFAPLGPKKKLLFLSRVGPQLISTGLPELREIQSYDNQQILDSIGKFLIGPRRLAVGQIPDQDRVPLLKAVVGHLYAELQDRVAALAPEGLLERLVAMNERIVFEQEFRRLTLPTQISCFSSIPLRAERLEKEMPNLASAGVACRFLIEYVAAQPPQGTQAFSLAAYDRLLALANEIVGLANVSDALHYRLAERPCEVLPSGRLALGQGALEMAIDSFMGAYALGEIRRAGDQFARHWRAATPRNSKQYPALIERMDTACQEEFGHSFTQMIAFLNAVVSLGISLDGEPACLPWSEFIGALAGNMHQDAACIETMVNLFALQPRPNFLRPPDGFVIADIYPWRFNRALSYLRRPLLIRQGLSGKEVVWGVRNVDQAGHYLANLCFGGRLKAASRVMQQLMGDLHNADGAAFNHLVADMYRKAGGFVVRERVRKIGGHRLSRINGEELGDIDVLVADPVGQRLIPAEAKGFAAALTPAELSNEVSELFGIDGEAGAVQRHLERTQWVREHVAETLQTLGLSASNVAEWVVEPLVVLERELLSPFLARVDLQVVSLERLREILGVTLET